jgi:hypothetical protein
LISGTLIHVHILPTLFVSKTLWQSSSPIIKIGFPADKAASQSTGGITGRIQHFHTGVTGKMHKVRRTVTIPIQRVIDNKQSIWGSGRYMIKDILLIV